MRRRGWVLDRHQTDVPSQQQPARPPAQSGLVQPDIEQLGAFRHESRHHIKAMGHGEWDLPPPLVPQVRMAPRSTKIVTANVWQQILQLNERRVYFIIANRSGTTIDMSFGRPIGNTGIPIANNTNFALAGFVCPIDDIWIMSSSVNSFITAYEGIPTTRKFGPDSPSGIDASQS